MIFGRKWVESERRGARRGKGKWEGERRGLREAGVLMYIYNNIITNNLFINNSLCTRVIRLCALRARRGGWGRERIF